MPGATTPSSAPKTHPLYFLDFDGTCTKMAGRVFREAAKTAGYDDKSPEGLVSFAMSGSEDKETVAHQFRDGVADMFMNYFNYLISPNFDSNNRSLEIMIVTRAESEFVKLMLTQLLIEKGVISEEQRNNLPENIQGFMNNIKATYEFGEADLVANERLCRWYKDGNNKWRKNSISYEQAVQQGELKHTERDKVNIITKVLRDRKITGTSEVFFFEDDPQEVKKLSTAKASTAEIAYMTIGDENDFSNQLPTMNALIQNGLAGTAASEASHLDPKGQEITSLLNSSPPSGESHLDSISQEITSSPSSSSTSAAFFKKKASMAVAMFGSISSLGTLAYLQYHGPDGMSFLDGLKDIPNNASTLGLAIVGGVCIALLIATAVAACRSGSETDYTQLERTGGQ